ncbi:hypothetical protein B0H13DRAFT_2062847 [Mycena leptocephala]|nr:hypothetical protein B0H13DRAFT_2062847 [Mycena leptocephala]
MALSLIGLSRVSRLSRRNLKATDAQMKLQEQLRVDLTSSQRKLEESEQQRRALENAKEVEDKLQAAEAARHELNPHGGWCSVPVRTPVRIRSHISKKCMDYDYSDGNGSKSLHQFDAISSPNQKFEIHPVGPKGFSIRHIASGHYIGDSRVYMVMYDFPSIFTFEARVDSGSNWYGNVL